jgi:hypothetical protein
MPWNGMGGELGQHGDAVSNLQVFFENAYTSIGRWIKIDRCANCRAIRRAQPLTMVAVKCVPENLNAAGELLTIQSVAQVLENPREAREMCLSCETVTDNSGHVSSVEMPKFFASLIMHEETVQGGVRRRRSCPCLLDGGFCCGEWWEAFACVWHD